MLLDDGKVPQTHHLRQRLITEGFDGVVYPSFMSPGGTCVALWRWNAKGAPRLDVVDPDGRLPKTPASWV
jgi:RES domain-containing protein